MIAQPTSLNLKDRIMGGLIGLLVGDALGLPAEGICPARIKKLWPGAWEHHFLFGRGMLSDDSEHAFMTGQSLLANPREDSRFARSLAWKLRWWLAALPAGVGLATLRACLKLWLGFPPSRSGIFSAGNGPAMRAPIIGAFFSGDSGRMRSYVRASTLLTHTDPRAFTGAFAIASISACIVNSQSFSVPSIDQVVQILSSAGTDPEWISILSRFQSGFARGESVAEFAAASGCSERGVSGYIYQTVPVAIYAWLRHYGNFEETLTSILNLGGDTDTVGAIAGALAGAVVGINGIPERWRAGILEWPRTIDKYSQLAKRLAIYRENGSSSGPVKYFWPAIPLRNLVFLLVVLFHGFRRLLPPY